MMTRGICQLPPETQLEIWFAVNHYDDFSEGNDPYGEHDFGSVDIIGVGKIFWKIDYYANAKCDAGCPDPADADNSFRVLTIMLAEEY